MKNWKRLFYKYRYIFLLVGVIAVFFYPTILSNKIPLPSDSIVGMYHPFRDNIWDSFTAGVPFKNFLITDSVRQQYVWRELAISQYKIGQLPLWNPYSFSGNVLLANFQSAVFYPLNILFFILPFISGWTITVILQPLLAGLFLYFYLQNLSLGKSACFLGSMAFCFSGFVISWLEWNTIVHVVLWLPLILLASEKLLKKVTFKWTVIYFISSLSQIFAGHLQFLFYSLVISNIYLLLRIVMLSFSESKTGHRLAYMARKYAVFVMLNLIVLLITSVQWLPTFRFIQLSARNIDQTKIIEQGISFEQGWFIPWQNLVQFLAPDFFGNPATNNYWGVWNYAEFVGYIGILPLILAVYALIFRFDKKVIFFGSFFFLSLLFALPTPLAILPYVFKIPLLSTSQPSRLIYVAVFSLSVLAALGLDHFLRHKNFRKILSIIVFFSIVFILLWLFVSFSKNFGVRLTVEQMGIAKRNLILPSLVFVFNFVLLLLITKGKKRSNFFILFVLMVYIGEILRFGWKFTPFAEKAWVYPPTKLITIMLNDKDNFRFMSLDRRIMPPNFSVGYRLQDVSGYDPLYLLKYNRLAGAWERDRPDISGAAFNRIVTPSQYTNFLTNLLGVKYVLSYGPQESEKLQLVDSEGQTFLYKNTGYFPRAFLVEKVIYAPDSIKVMEMMYSLKDKLLDTAVLQEKVNLAEKKLDTQEKAEIEIYSNEYIRLLTHSNIDRLLVLTDIYYPTWTVSVDGLESKLYEVDFILRGVIVPEGIHTVEFQNHLL